ncbi:MAG TPA: TonB-dependent receptor plug domain-containing protein [Desulfuromonadales bacterium]|nr:TonB-dependent receptor plug domain-containing protein [Desulfuromonadales bacterium]
MLIVLVVSSVSAYADDDSSKSLLSPETLENPITLSTTNPRPISITAENTTVITAADISRLNAHTLADVLQTIPGIQLDYQRSPGTFTLYNIQGAINTTVMVLIDGIRQNDFLQHIAVPGLITVQQIERIEIIKGAASTAWGAALGGIINIITKSPNLDRPVSGMVSASTGSQFTSDSRAELSGTLDRFGYYLTAGHLRSDGLSPNTATSMNNLYSKLSYLLPGKGTATFGLSYLAARPGLDEGDTVKWGFVHDNNQYRRTNGFLKFSQPLGNKLTLDIDGYITNRDDQTKWGGRNEQGDIVFFNHNSLQETTRGISTRIFWGDAQRNLAARVDYGHAHSSDRDLLTPDPPSINSRWDNWALSANGAYTFGKLTLLPGVRYDITGISGDYFSYTLGATYRVTESTSLRAYAAQGNSLSFALDPRFIQKTKTVQGGVESGAVPYLWLKGTYFYNTLRDNQSMGEEATKINQIRQGFELEARSTALYGFSLASGYTYLFAKNSDTGERLKTDSNQTVPPHLVKLAINYDNTGLGLRGTLIGNYVWWNAPIDSFARDGGMIWNLHLNWKLRPAYGVIPELFFSGHNLFNGVQSTDTSLFTNTRRWFEGGVRFAF